MGIFKKLSSAKTAVTAPQTYRRNPFDRLESYTPLASVNNSLYRELREAVPVLDAAIYKIVRLTGGFRVECADQGVEEAVNSFLRGVPVGGNQTARIFDAVCERVSGKVTSFGEPYVCVKAKAYMPRTVKNNDLIAEIEAGIKKEVSVSCAVSTFTCSVCGEDMRGGKCKHLKGRSYGQEICSCILSDVTDAYEWSFVAIPAQINAGVTKGFGRFAECEDIIKAVSEGSCVKLTQEQSRELCAYIDSLEEQAQEGRLFRKSLTDEAVRFACIALPELDREAVSKMCSAAQIAELIKIKDAFRLKAGGVIPLSPQLKAKKEKPNVNNNEFKF
ncbi:MAG: hypothetical protein IIU80_03160 [Clostridia bacterium]|nr:hypothetical protein [Clostridia bacterium]